MSNVSVLRMQLLHRPKDGRPGQHSRWLLESYGEALWVSMGLSQPSHPAAAGAGTSEKGVTMLHLLTHTGRLQASSIPAGLQFSQLLFILQYSLSVMIDSPNLEPTTVVLFSMRT